MFNRRRTFDLRRLEPGELWPGRFLPGHVRDGAGRILIRGGQVLTGEHLRHLTERGSAAVYGGPEWDSERSKAEADDPGLSPTELLQALKRRHGVRGGQKPGRRHTRYTWRCRMKLTIQECSDGLVQRRQVTVETCDVSGSGFAFISQQFVHVGTIVFPRFECLPNRPVLKGVVRYCHHLEARRHRVGVEFVPLDPDEQLPPVAPPDGT